MNNRLYIQRLKQLPRVSQEFTKEGFEKFVAEKLNLGKDEKALTQVEEFLEGVKGKALTAAGQIIASLSKDALEGLASKGTAIVNTFNSVLKPIEDMNSQFGTSTIVTSQIFKNFQDIAEQQENSFLTAQDFAKSAGELNTLLPGTAALFSMQTELGKELLDIQTKSTEQLGVQPAQAAAFNTFLLANKESAGGVLDELTSTASTIEMATGQTGVLRDMLNAVGATTAVTRMTFRGSADELGRAALQANRMGTTLDQVAQSAKSMLDVESQIGSEMEFQLLTGKNISQQTNEMRIAAMTGDMDKQLEIQGDLIEQNYESLKGNPIAMEAFAKSIGLSSEQMASQAETIKARNALLEETSKIPTLELNELLNEFNVDSIEKLAALEGQKGKDARDALKKKLGSDAKIIEKFDKMTQAMDQRTQEQKLQASIDTLSNAITKAFIGETGENIKNTVQLQDNTFREGTKFGRNVINTGAEVLRSAAEFEAKNAVVALKEGLEKITTQAKELGKALFNDPTTKQQIAKDFKDIFDSAFAQSKRFSKEVVTDNRSSTGEPS
jgi:hypothetical protein